MDEINFVVLGSFTYSLLGEVRHACEVYCYNRFIPNYPCVMTWRDMVYISRAKLFFTSIIHFDSHSSRYHIASMCDLATFSLDYRFYTFLPTPSWFNISSSYCDSVTQSC